MTPHQTPPVSGLPTQDILLNASSLKFTHCSQRYHNAVVRGLRSKEERESLTFGKALHKYAELRQRGTETTAAVQLALAQYEGVEADKLAMACMVMPPDGIKPYVDSEGRPYLELKFKIYWRSIVYNGVQYNIYVCGTLDLVTFRSDASLQIIDYKSSRKWSYADVFAAYRTSVQMSFYLWVAWKFGYHLFDMPLANAAHDGNLFINIHAIFLSAKPPKWLLGPPIQASIPELEAFEELIINQLNSVIIPGWTAPRMSGKINDTCAACYCDYTGLCFAENSAQYDQALDTFNAIKYDPATF